MRINEAAELAGVTVRTLHHYDKIGLLCPIKSAENGYRDYGETELLRLQQILFLREMDFSLEEIKEMLDKPDFDRSRMMEAQHELLIKKKQRLEKIISLLEAEMRGDNKMSFNAFDMKEIEECRKKYADEAREKWGGTKAYKESEERTENYDEGEWQKVDDEQGRIISEFAAFAAEGVKPDSSKAMALAAKWQDHISDNFYECTDDILAGLAEMYIADERFKKNLDKAGDGTAEFMSAAIKAYVESKEK
ncbi:MAG: MerR family transcriptional regulator [Anaerovoracaceae bacterium]